MYSELMASTPDTKSPSVRLTRKESQEETRRALIASAIELFARNGVSDSPLNAVAEHAGFSRGAVHGNFADKEELASAVVESVAGELGAQLTEVLAESASSGKRLAAYITTSMDYCRSSPDSAAAIVAAVSHLSRQHAQDYNELAEESVGDLVALFEDGQRRGEMRSFDPLTMALALRAVLDTAAAGLGKADASKSVPGTPEDIITAEFVDLFNHATRSATSATSTESTESTRGMES